METPLRLRICAGTVLLLSCGPLLACGDAPPPKFGGKPISAWIDQLDDRNAKKARDATDQLRDARFVVGAAELAVPALARRVDPKLPHGVRWSAVDALRAYGPMAAGAAGALVENPNTKIFDVTVLVARIAIGIDAPRHLARIQSHIREGFASTDALVALGATNAITSAARLGLRAGPVAETLAALAGRSPDVGTLVWFAEEVGPMVEPLRQFLFTVQDSKDADKVSRQRLAIAMSWLRDLPPPRLAGVLATTKAFSSEFSAGPILRGLAWSVHEPLPDVVALFRVRTSANDPLVAALAQVGLARLAPDPDKQVPPLLRLLTHSSGDVRSMAAEALRVLAPTAPAAATALRARLADEDLRVRWRVAVLLLTAGEQVDAALPEIVRAIDGPDDLERVAVFDAIPARQAAQPLAPRLDSWAACPFPSIAEPAKAARARLQDAVTTPDPK